MMIQKDKTLSATHNKSLKQSELTVLHSKGL